MNLTEIKEAVEKKYVALPIEWTSDATGEQFKMNLRNMIRLSDAEQDRVMEIGQAMKDSEDTNVAELRAQMRDFLTTLSDRPELVDVFLAEINHDIAIIVYIVEEYQKVTQAEKA